MIENRCEWGVGNDLMWHYHDTEWGTPLYDSKKLFEFLILDGFQAGLSWNTILQKRENFRAAFDNFEAEKIVRYDDKKISILLQDAGIIRNKLKIAAAVSNARAYLAIEKNGGFSEFLWSFTSGKPMINHFSSQKEIPTHSPESDAMSKALVKEGFKFVGTTICYAFMQAAGMVNDHLVTCFRHEEVQR